MWDPDGLAGVLEFARTHHTTGLMLSQHGEVVAEEHWPPDGQVLGLRQLADGRTREDVASAQKSVTSLLVGAAVAEGLLDLNGAVSSYVGSGWSRAEHAAEAAITVRHLLTMTSGLDDRLDVVAPPGTMWAYNLGAAYHTLKRVVSAVAGTDLPTLSNDWLFGPLELGETEWVSRPLPPGISDAMRPLVSYPDGATFEGLVTSARDLSRFGAAVLEVRSTGGGPLAAIKPYIDEALRPSTELNPAYGFLWWLNGQPWKRVPRVEQPIEGPLLPDAPRDLVAMLGAQGRAVYVVPSQQLVLVRIGADPGDGAPAGGRFGQELWARLRAASSGWETT